MKKGTAPPLQCQFCDSDIGVTFSSPDHAQILSCRCSEYPLLEGILYLRKDLRAKRCIRLIKNNLGGLALFWLSRSKPALLIPTVVFLLRRSNIKFGKFVSIFKFFGYDRAWASYLVNRNKDASYKLSVIASGMLHKNGKSLDFGCGIGQLLPFIAKRVGPGNLYAVDISFLDLLIARRFFANSKTLLICADGEYGIPFKEDSLKTIISTDAFYNLSKKRYFLEETARTLTRRGNLLVIHTINSSKIVYDRVKGIKTDKVLKILKKLKFVRISMFGETEPLPVLKKPYIQKNFKENEPYTFFASKNTYQ